MALRNWSFAQILLASAALFVGTCVILLAAATSMVMQVDAGTAGIGAVSVDINAVTLAIPLVPPLILVAAWLLARRRSRRVRPT